MLETLVNLQNVRGRAYLPGPEIDPEEYVMETIVRTEEEREHTFGLGSLCTEGLLHLYARQNMKQHVAMLWPDMSKGKWRTFTPTHEYDLYRWHIEHGKSHTWYLPLTLSWSELKKVAGDSKGNGLPGLLTESPWFYLVFLMVFPHRFSSSGARWLSARLAD
jgi:hypothetical protein